MKFISKYSNDKEVSAAQFVTELICENKAKSLKKDLHYRFWCDKEWEKFFKNQIASAHRLIKKYDPIDIVRALKTPKGQRIYSLRAKHLIPIILEQQSKTDDMKKSASSLQIERKESPVVQKHKVKKNILNTLEDL
jgi:hypothetical protein